MSMKPSIGPKPGLVYRIDADDRLCAVSPAWSEFALANEGVAVLPHRVLGRSLWDFISDPGVTELYRQMTRRARTGHPVRFDFRCDAPQWRRSFQMTVGTVGAGMVEFNSMLQWQEERPRVPLLDAAMRRDRSFVRVCSWCQWIALPDGSWTPVEKAVAQLGLLESEALPALTHGICPPCETDMMKKLG